MKQFIEWLVDAAEERARLHAFEEIHDAWEFTFKTEKQFDTFLHKEIVRLRKATALRNAERSRA